MLESVDHENHILEGAGAVYCMKQSEWNIRGKNVFLVLGRDARGYQIVFIDSDRIQRSQVNGSCSLSFN